MPRSENLIFKAARDYVSQAGITISFNWVIEINRARYQVIIELPGHRRHRTRLMADFGTTCPILGPLFLIFTVPIFWGLHAE